MAEPPRRPVAKPYSVHQLGRVDVGQLRTQVARLSEKVWRQEDALKENDHFCFTHTQHIVFRFVPLDLPGVAFYSRPLWNLWRTWLLPVMAEAAAPYGFAQPVYPKAMLARLAAGHGIDLHTDSDGMNPFVHKIHVPLQTNPQATLTSAGVTHHLQAGCAYEVNNLASHGAFNGGDEDRIHFIFEVFEGAGIAWREQRWEDGPAAKGAHVTPNSTEEGGSVAA